MHHRAAEANRKVDFFPEKEEKTNTGQKARDRETDDRETDEREEETESKRERHVIMKSRGRQAVCIPSINCQLPNFVSLIHFFSSLPPSSPSLCLS